MFLCGLYYFSCNQNSVSIICGKIYMVKVSIMGKQSHNQHDTVRLHSVAIFLVVVADTPKRDKFSVQSKNHKRN